MDISSTRYHKEGETMTNEWSISVAVKKTMLCFFSILLLSLLIGLAFSVPGLPGQIHTRKILFMSTMFIVGIGHIFIFPKWQIDLAGTKLRSPVWFTLLLGFTMLMGNCLSFYFIPLADTGWAIAGALAFIFPALVQFTWQYADIAFAPPVAIAAWQLPEATPDEKVPIFLNSIGIKLHVKVKYYDISETHFGITVPGRMLMGEMFHRFVIDKEAALINIQVFNKEHQPFGWRFIVQKKIGNKTLDPAKSLVENEVKQDDIILIERV